LNPGRGEAMHPTTVKSSDASLQLQRITLLKSYTAFNNIKFLDIVMKTVTHVMILKIVSFILLHNMSRLLAINFYLMRGIKSVKL
jgi:hypothetical protein